VANCEVKTDKHWAVKLKPITGGGTIAGNLQNTKKILNWFEDREFLITDAIEWERYAREAREGLKQKQLEAAAAKKVAKAKRDSDGRKKRKTGTGTRDVIPVKTVNIKQDGEDNQQYIGVAVVTQDDENGHWEVLKVMYDAMDDNWELPFGEIERGVSLEANAVNMQLETTGLIVSPDKLIREIPEVDYGSDTVWFSYLYTGEEDCGDPASHMEVDLTFGVVDHLMHPDERELVREVYARYQVQGSGQDAPPAVQVNVCQPDLSEEDLRVLKAKVEAGLNKASARERVEYGPPKNHGPLNGKGFKPRVLFDTGAGRCTRPKRLLDMNTRQVAVASVEREFEAEQTLEGEILAGCETICAGDFAVSQAGFTFIWTQGCCVLVRYTNAQAEDLKRFVETKPKSQLIRLDDSSGTPFLSTEGFEDVRKRGGLSPIPAYKSFTEENTARATEEAMRTRFLAQRKRVQEKYTVFHGLSSQVKEDIAESLKNLMKLNPSNLPGSVRESIDERLKGSARYDKIVRREGVWNESAQVKMIACEDDQTDDQRRKALVQDMEDYLECLYVSAAVSLGVSLEVEDVCERLKGFVYNPSLGNASVRLSKEGCVVDLWRGGTLVLRGAESEEVAKIALRKVAKQLMMREFPVRFKQFRITNYVHAYPTGRHINLAEAARALGEHGDYSVTFEPELRHEILITVKTCQKNLKIHILRGGMLKSYGKAVPQTVVIEMCKLLNFISIKGLFIELADVKMLGISNPTGGPSVYREWCERPASKPFFPITRITDGQRTKVRLEVWRHVDDGRHFVWRKKTTMVDAGNGSGPQQRVIRVPEYLEPEHLDALEYERADTGQIEKYRIAMVMTSSVSDVTNDTEKSIANSYSHLNIQPIDYIHQNSLDFAEGNVLKYISRHRKKGGREDVLKAMHYCQIVMQQQYGTESTNGFLTEVNSATESEVEVAKYTLEGSTDRLVNLDLAFDPNNKELYPIRSLMAKVYRPEREQEVNYEWLLVVNALAKEAIVMIETRNANRGLPSRKQFESKLEEVSQRIATAIEYIDEIMGVTCWYTELRHAWRSRDLQQVAKAVYEVAIEADVLAALYSKRAPGHGHPVAVPVKTMRVTDSERVKNFTKCFGIDIPVVPRPISTSMTLRLIKSVVDELLELASTVVEDAVAKQTIIDHVLTTRQLPMRRYDDEMSKLADQIDAMVDSYYYILDTGCIHGINLNSYFAAVHQANMAKIDSKTRTLQTDRSGKVIKPPGWKPPDHVSVLQKVASFGSWANMPRHVRVTTVTSEPPDGHGRWPRGVKLWDGVRRRPGESFGETELKIANGLYAIPQGLVCQALQLLRKAYQTGRGNTNPNAEQEEESMRKAIEMLSNSSGQDLKLRSTASVPVGFLPYDDDIVCLSCARWKERLGVPDVVSPPRKRARLEEDQYNEVLTPVKTLKVMDELPYGDRLLIREGSLEYIRPASKPYIRCSYLVFL